MSVTLWVSDINSTKSVRIKIPAKAKRTKVPEKKLLSKTPRRKRSVPQKNAIWGGI
jgi:hypothetical protein